nr:hypothetical protein [Tanacetum cinerariifolium]
MIAILEKYEHNTDFYQIVDFVEASHLRYALTINPTVYVSYIRQFWSTARIETTDEGTKILAILDGKPRTISESSIRRNLKLKDEAGISSLPDAKLFENLTLIGSGTPTEPHHTPSPEAQQTSPTATSSPSHPPVRTEPIPTIIPTDTPQLKHYTRRARIAQSSSLPTTADEPASPIGDDSQGQHATQVYRIDRFVYPPGKARIKHLEDKDRGDDDPSGEDTTINGRRLETGEEAGIERSTEKDSDDTEEMANVLTSLDAASVLTSGVQVIVPPAVEVVTVSIPLAGEIPTISVPTGSGMVPTAKSDTPKKKKLQEQIDVQVARELEEEMEYEQAAAELTIREKIELINELVKYQDHLASILKYKAQQRIEGITLGLRELTGEITGSEIGELTGSENLRSIIRHTTSSSDCFQITSRVSNGVARKSTRARSKGIVGVHKLGEMKNPLSKHLVFEEPELDKQELGELKVGKPRVDKQ